MISCLHPTPVLHAVDKSSLVEGYLYFHSEAYNVGSKKRGSGLVDRSGCLCVCLTKNRIGLSILARSSLSMHTATVRFRATTIFDRLSVISVYETFMYNGTQSDYHGRTV